MELKLGVLQSFINKQVELHGADTPTYLLYLDVAPEDVVLVEDVKDETCTPLDIMDSLLAAKGPDSKTAFLGILFRPADLLAEGSPPKLVVDNTN